MGVTSFSVCFQLLAFVLLSANIAAQSSQGVFEDKNKIGLPNALLCTNELFEADDLCNKNFTNAVLANVHKELKLTYDSDAKCKVYDPSHPEGRDLYTQKGERPQTNAPGAVTRCTLFTNSILGRIRFNFYSAGPFGEIVAIVYYPKAG